MCDYAPDFTMGSQIGCQLGDDVKLILECQLVNLDSKPCTTRKGFFMFSKSPAPKNESPVLGKRAAAVPVDDVSKASVESAGKHARTEDTVPVEGSGEEDEDSSDFEPEPDPPAAPPEEAPTDSTRPEDEVEVAEESLHAEEPPSGGEEETEGEDVVDSEFPPPPELVKVNVKPSWLVTTKTVKELEAGLQALQVENQDLHVLLSAYHLLTPEELVERRGQQRAQLMADAADLKREIASGREEIKELQAQKEELSRQVEELRYETVWKGDLLTLQTSGHYKFSHPLENVDEYEDRLADLRERVENAILGEKAVSFNPKWALNGSVKQGQTLIEQVSKLVLRTYNGEVEQIIGSLEPGGREVAIDRLTKHVRQVAKLGKTMRLEIDPDYHLLRVEEVNLVADYLEMSQGATDGEERETAAVTEAIRSKSA